MATKIEKLSCFEVKIRLDTGVYDLGAGNKPSEASAGRFQTADDAPAEVFEEILAKLIKAIHDGDDTIDVNVLNNKLIVRDPSFIPPLLEAHAVLGVVREVSA